MELLVDALEKLAGDTVKTSDIHLAMVETCLDKGTEPHLAVAARLTRGDIYRQVYGSSKPCSFSESYKKLVETGYWMDFGISPEDMIRLDEAFTPETDKLLEYASLCQFIDKYGLGEGFGLAKVLVETPALCTMGIALNDFYARDGIEHAINYYDIIKFRKINIATPIMASSRTGDNGSASCFVYTTGDSLKSIAAGNELGYIMSANRAGIGMEFDIRSLKDTVANGKCQHAGKIPHYKALQAIIETAKQGVRSGAATITFSALDPEFEDLVRMKHPTTDETKRFPKMDFSMAYNMEFLRRAKSGREWLLISKIHAPDLYAAQYVNREDFPGLLTKYLDLVKDGKVKGKVVRAMSMLKTYCTQWQETGRVYSLNLDHANDHTPFKKPIRISNLCQEIMLPTHEFKNSAELDEEANPDKGVVGLCFLMAIDIARTSDEEYAHVAYYAARALDNIIEGMNYPFLNLESGKKYRSIGIGITNMAYRLARDGLNYDDQYSRTEIHKIAERHQFSLYKASVELAKERGRFEWYDKTHYPEGKLCIDTYNKNIDKFHDAELEMDWEGLKADIAKYGLRFSTHSAHMPCESSSMYGYSTNGLYPIRNYKVIKSRPEGLAPFPAPGLNSIGMNYQLAWGIATKDMYTFYGIMQKFTCQGISADTYEEKSQYHEERIPMDTLVGNFFYAAYVGIKTGYYFNTDGKSSKELDCESCDV